MEGGDREIQTEEKGGGQESQRLPLQKMDRQKEKGKERGGVRSTCLVGREIGSGRDLSLKGTEYSGR